MHRSVLLVLVSVLVLSVAFALPASQEESLEVDSQQELKAESVEKVNSIEVDKASDSSEEEQKDTAKDKADNSSDSISSDEAKRRSVRYEKLRNLVLLAAICPKKDLKNLEEDPIINVRIEAENMLAMCAELKDKGEDN